MQTPYFLIHKDKLDNEICKMKSELEKYWGNYIIGYSIKTNSLPWIISYMKLQGLYAEAVSSDELALALKLGFKNDMMIFNGPVKGKKEFIESIKTEGIINIDSWRELLWLSEEKLNIKAQIGLRINFDLENKCCGETQCGEEDGRFGFSFEQGELLKAITFLAEGSIPLSGLHIHFSSKTRSLKIYREVAEAVVEIISKYCLEVQYIDIGGGFFGSLEGKPTYDDYFECITKILRKVISPEKTKLIVEPGISLVGAPISYVTSVIDVKNTLHNRFITTDGSRLHIDPFMHKNSYDYSINRKTHEILTGKQTICGFTCIENDRLFKEIDSAEISVDDQIIYHKVGAYTMGLSSLFIQFFPAVYVRQGEEIICVREKWNVEDVIRKSRLEGF